MADQPPALDRRRSGRQGWHLHPGGLQITLAALALLLALLVTLRPLVERGLPGTNDGQFHLYRLLFLHRALVEGGSLGRWLPDVAYGYGAPVFNYYAPASYSLGLAAVVVGAGYVGGLKVAYGFPVVLSALTMLLLVRSLFGTVPAIVAATIYVCLPYLLLNLYIRGALAETAAFVWLPLVPWCLLRLREDSRICWVVALALTTAGLVVTHNITSLLALPVFTGLAVVLGWPFFGMGRGVERRYLFCAMLGIALGLGLGAAYWLPALVEKGLVQADEALIPPETMLTYFVQGLPPFQTSLAYDYRNLGGADSKIGVMQLLVAALGLVGVLLARGIHRRFLLCAAGLFLIAWGLQFRAAAPLFDVIPLVSYIQFPWRLLSLVGLATGVLAGALVWVVPVRAGLRLLAGLALVALTLYAGLAQLTPELTLVEDRYLTAEGVLRNEQAGFGTGTTVFGEFLPSGLGYRGSDALREAIVASSDGDHADGSSEPVEYRVWVRAWEPMHVHLHVEAPRPDRLLLHQSFFPGWHATVDGVAAPVLSIGRPGLVAIDVPDGTHEIDLSFGLTPPRLVGWLVSGASLVGLVILLAVGAIPRRAGVLRRGRVGSALTASVFLTIMLAGVVGAGGMWPTPASALAPLMEDRWQPVGERLVLTGSSVDQTRVAADGLLTVRLDWLSLAGQDDEYDAWVRLTMADGTMVTGRWAYGSVMSSWQRGEVVRTQTDLRLAGRPPDGEGRLSLLLGRRGRRNTADVEEIDLGSLSLPASQSASPNGLLTGTPVEDPAAKQVFTALVLHSYELRAKGASAPQTVRPGDVLDVHLGWSVIRPSLQDVNVTVELRGPGRPISSEARNIGEWFHPFLGWQTGDQIGQQLRIVTSADAQVGQYEVWLRASSRRRGWARIGPGPVQAEADVRSGAQTEVRLGSLTLK